jgi:aminocarboxymuconate-semialdehyde decarboxylase
MVGGPQYALELAQIANDGMADLCDAYPERFPGFVASVPLNDADAMVAESIRALEGLKAVGVQIFTNALGKPLDAPEYWAFYDLMARMNKPIWIHPTRGPDQSDYSAERTSKYEIWWTFGWPYETSVLMARLVFAKLFDKHPDIKIITHHGGGMIPFFEGRVGPGWDQLGSRTSGADYGSLLTELRKRPIDYFRQFYADTALFGSLPATECALSFFGVDRVLFASDAPFDPERGPMYIRETIRVIERLEISEGDRRKIFSGNAIAALGLVDTNKTF